MENFKELENKMWAYAEDRPPTTNAEMVVGFLRSENIGCCLSAPALEAGMRKMPYWSQGAGNYLQFALACTAAMACLPA